MRDLGSTYKFILLALVPAIISGCSNEPVKSAQPTRVESNLGIKGAPDWVNKGSNILNTLDRRLFHGVGSASPQGDMALQKAIADDRARAEVARILSSYLDVVSTDYMATAKSGASGEKIAAVSEETVSRQIKNTTKVNMAGARIIGSWRDPASQTIWSIAELDMKYVKSTMAGVIEMDADLKRHIETSSDNIFDHLSKEKK
jgi:hypothetical protein